MFNIGCAPWFIAADVCKALGITNARDALAKCLDDEEKGVERIYTPGGPQNLRTVSESGMYALTMRSNKPQAKRWHSQQAVPQVGHVREPRLAAAVLPACHFQKTTAPINET